MFPHLLSLITGRPPPELERNPFVREVHIRHRERANPKVERLIFICWVLIAVKHVLIIWACQRYAVPFHQLWVNFPTWVAGALATGIYYWQVRRR